MARKHLGWYSKGLPSSAEFRVAVNTKETHKDIKALVDQFYLPLVSETN
jgi:tRNA-dihydrouridine synthase